MGVATRSRLAFPPAEVSLEREAALSVSTQSVAPFDRVFNVDGFSWVIDEPVCDILGRAVLVTEDDVFLGDRDVHSCGDGSRVRISQVADDAIVSWREQRFHTNELFSRSERISDVFEVTGQSLLKTVHDHAWFAASCSSDGLLAVVHPQRLPKTSEVSSMLETVATAHTNAHPTSNAGTSLGRHCSTTHPSQSASHCSVDSHLAGDEHASGSASGQQPLARTQGRESGGENLEFRCPCSSQDVQDSNFLELSGMTMHQTRHSGASSSKTRSMESIQQCGKIRQKQSAGNRAEGLLLG